MLLETANFDSESNCGRWVFIFVDKKQVAILTTAYWIEVKIETGFDVTSALYCYCY